MAYTVLNLCETTLLKDLSLLTQHNLEKPVRWFHVAELSQDLNDLERQLKDGDLLIIMGPFLHNDPGTLMQVVDIASDKSLSCVLLFNHVLQDDIPDNVIAFAKRKKVTLACITGKNPPITDLTSVISQTITEYNFALPEFLPFHLLRDIIHGDFYNDISLFHLRAQSLGFDLSVPHQGLCLRATPKTMAEPASSNKVHNRVWMECADGVLSHYFKHPYLKSNTEPDSFFLIPKTYVSIDTIGEQIIEACKKKDTDELYEFRLGIGNMYADAREFSTTMKEASQVVEILELMGRKNTHCQANNILLSLLIRAERDNPLFLNLFQTNIQPLLEMDVSEKNDLVHTLEAYFECGCNISQAADMLYVHRNTMRSRLEVIQSLTHRDLKDPLDRLELQLTLHYYKLNLSAENVTK